MPRRDDDTRSLKIDDIDHAAHIASLNDAFCRNPVSGRLVVTAGVITLGDQALPAILQKVAAYDEFNAGNDPYGEHDFGSFDHNGERLFWKIDYYDRGLRTSSPDPANPAVTTRVLTVMLAGEY